MSIHSDRAWWKRSLALLVLALVAMPVMALIVPWAWTVAAGFPGVRLTSDQIVALLWLPVLTVYAGAAITLAAFFNKTFTWEPGRDIEIAWHVAALAGDRNARWLLWRNDIRWAVLLAMAGAFFWVAR